MTLDEFRATGRDVPDLGAIEHIAASGQSGPGRVYQDELFIVRAEHTWRVPVGNVEIDCARLTDAEEELYRFAVSEGYINE